MQIVYKKKVGRLISRKKREWYPGAVYHLMERGVRKHEIFQKQSDFEIFLILLKDAAINKQCKVHAYCLMTNHFHLLLETGNERIDKFMASLASRYAMYYNHEYGYCGHVFEGRYKACLVKDDAYFLQTSRYIHLNPVKARMVEHAEDYKWSSYRSMLSMCDDGILDRQRTMKYFGSKGIWGYRDFVEDVAHKYVVMEDEIKKSMGEDELWLPW